MELIQLAESSHLGDCFFWATAFIGWVESVVTYDVVGARNCSLTVELSLASKHGDSYVIA